MVYHFTKYECLFGIIQPCQIIINASHYSIWEEDDYQAIKRQVEPLIKEICESKSVKYDDAAEIDPYVISFTALLHNEYMWEQFGDNHYGVALAFDDDVLKIIANRDSDPDVFMECHYPKKEENIKQWLLNCREDKFPSPTINNPQDDLTTISVFLLPIRFYEEHEWRYAIPFHKSTHSWVETDEPQFQNSSIGKIMELELPMNALKGIYYGREVTVDEIEITKKYVRHCGFELPDDSFLQLN